MSEEAPTEPKIVQLDKVRAAAKNKRKHESKSRGKKDGAGSGGGERPPPTPTPRLPEKLPDNSPVKALGANEGVYFYLDSLGQLRRLTEDKHGRLHIISLFGGWDYLRETWPVWKLEDDGQWVRKTEFAHAHLAPVLMSSCRERGVWDPNEKVRGCGAWMEDDGALVMHCGSCLYINRGGMVLREDAGVRGELLYPRRAPLPEPDLIDSDSARTLLEKLDTWNFKRGRTDACIVLGWVMQAMLGQAPPWRPMMWVTGGSWTGKSTLQKLIEWLLGAALIKPSNTTPAYVYQRIGDSSLPVTLDEFEAKEDNRRVADVIELMRIAASGGDVGRGGSDGNAKTYTMRSCFSAFSIMIPPMAAQDRSRMAIVELLERAKKEITGDPKLDLVAASDHDLVLGPRAKWAAVGRMLRGRLLSQWPRYMATFNTYNLALMSAGHNARAAAQFGALGAGCDIALYDRLDPANALEWAKSLPASDLAETKGYLSEPEGCLQHLLAFAPDLVRGGQRETIAHYLRQARSEGEMSSGGNYSDDASRLLAKHGIKIFRDRELVTFDEGREERVWWVAVASTHPALAKIFESTHWKGKSGAPGTWAQALRGLPGAAEKAIRMRIDGQLWWVTRVMYDVIFPPFTDATDGDEIEAVDVRDRDKTRGERLV